MAQHNSSYIIWRLYRCLIICLIISAIASIPAYAGEYHNPKERTTSQIETLACAQCHTMHGSQGAGVGPGSLIYDGTPAIYPKLLRAANVLLLCLFCHGDVSPGVIDGNNPFPNGSRTPPQILNNTIAPTYIPSAGDFADGGSVNEANRHSIGLSGFTPPGNNNATGWSAVTTKFGDTIVCLYCHDQHGNRNYRNFRYDPGNPANDNFTNGVKVSYRLNATGNCSDDGAPPCDVDNDSNTDFATYGNRAKYQRKNVIFNKTAGVDYNRIAGWCGKCHTRFFDISNSPTNEATGPYLGGTTGGGVVGPGDTNTGNPGTPWKRHPVGDDNLGQGVTNMHVDFSAAPYINKNLVRVVDPTNANDVADNNDQPFCLTCHYSHGGGNPNRTGTATLDHSNLVMLTDAGALNLKGATGATYRMRNTCLQCHNQ